MDISETDDASVVGEEAHIIARETNGPRGDNSMPIEERDKYNNLILMCSIHHKNIDDFPERFPVELLHQYKLEHEAWVKVNLGFDKVKQHEDEAYSSYLDQLLILAEIDNFKGWTSFLFGGDHPRMRLNTYNALRELVQYIISRIWYGRYSQLEDAFVNFKNVLNDLLNVFDEYSEPWGNDALQTKKFYKISDWNPNLYDKLLDDYTYHVHLITDLTLELARAGNLLFETVRKHLFPGFRVHEGVLIVEIGPFMDLSWKTLRPEYRLEEKQKHPYPGLRKFMEIRSQRDVNWGKGVNENYFPNFY
ncbi:HNH endonuclease [Sphingobacterium siyangense]|uniref:HNH endonuclease n=1 Tax=Sphingobacterium siyangense TaxID=459529 RepID=UPI002FDD2FA7